MDGKWFALGAVGGLAALSMGKRGSSSVSLWPFRTMEYGMDRFMWKPAPGFSYELRQSRGHGCPHTGRPARVMVVHHRPGDRTGYVLAPPRESLRALLSDVSPADFHFEDLHRSPEAFTKELQAWKKVAIQHFAEHHPEEFRKWVQGSSPRNAEVMRGLLRKLVPKLAKRMFGSESTPTIKKGSSARRKKPDAPWPFFQTRKFNEFTWGPADQIRYDLDVASDPRSSVNLAYFAPGARTGTWLFPPGPSIRKLGQDVGDFDPRSWAAKWDWALIAVQHFSDHHPEEFRRWASGHARHRLYIELPKLAKRVLGPEKKGSSSYKVYSIRHHGPVTVWGDEEWRNPDFQSGDYALWWGSEDFKDAESITEVEGDIVREYTCLAGYVDEPNFEPETPDWAVQEIYLSEDDLHDGKGGVRDSVGWMASIGVELIQERGGEQYELHHDEVMGLDPSPQQALPLGQKKKGSPSLDWISWSENAPYALEDLGVRRDFWSAKTSHGTYEWDLDELRYLPAGVTRAGDRSIEVWGGKRWRQRRPPKRPGVPISLEDAKRIVNEHHLKRRGIRSLRKK